MILVQFIIRFIVYSSDILTVHILLTAICSTIHHQKKVGQCHQVTMALQSSFYSYDSLIDCIITIFHMLLQNVETLVCLFFSVAPVLNAHYRNFNILVFLLDFKFKVWCNSTVSIYALKFIAFYYSCSVCFERPLQNFSSLIFSVWFWIQGLM